MNDKYTNILWQINKICYFSRLYDLTNNSYNLTLKLKNWGKFETYRMFLGEKAKNNKFILGKIVRYSDLYNS